MNLLSGGRVLDDYQRDMSVECGFRVAQYAHDENIGSIVLVDKAARNLHIPIREAYRQLETAEKPPTVYFLNPYGFLAPDIHSPETYAELVFHAECETDDLSPDEELQRLRTDRERTEKLLLAGVDLHEQEVKRNRRATIASELKSLIDQAVARDDQYNGRVLLLDACIHKGRAVRGIVRALLDAGIPDLRTGIVNDASNKSEIKPDFIVFNRGEILDECKPFGTQKGLHKATAGFSVGKGNGITPRERAFRDELHEAMKHSDVHRENFIEHLADGGFGESPVAAILRALLGTEAQQSIPSAYQVMQIGGAAIISMNPGR